MNEKKICGVLDTKLIFEVMAYLLCAIFILVLHYFNGITDYPYDAGGVLEGWCNIWIRKI